MKRFAARLRRYSALISNGLILHKLLMVLRRIGILIEPYYLFQEGPFEPRPESPGGDFEFRELVIANVPSLCALEGHGRLDAEFRRRFGAGHRCFALMHMGLVAGYTWCDTRMIGFAPCARPLAPHEAYFYGARTVFEHRGRQLQPYLRFYCYERLGSEGRSVLYSYCDYFNYPAVKFKEKLGARVLQTGLNLELFGVLKKHWSRRRPLPPGQPAPRSGVF